MKMTCCCKFVEVGVVQENPHLSITLSIMVLIRGWCKEETSLQKSFSFSHNIYSTICTCKTNKGVPIVKLVIIVHRASLILL